VSIHSGASIGDAGGRWRKNRSVVDVFNLPQNAENYFSTY